MREKILEISKKLENNEISEEEAKEEFLFLFGVKKSKSINKKSDKTPMTPYSEWVKILKDL